MAKLRNPDLEFLVNKTKHVEGNICIALLLFVNEEPFQQTLRITDAQSLATDLHEEVVTEIKFYIHDSSADLSHFKTETDVMDVLALICIWEEDEDISYEFVLPRSLNGDPTKIHSWYECNFGTVIKLLLET